MTEVSLDTSRSLCYFPDFSYKANTFISYAKVIQRMYIKVGGTAEQGASSTAAACRPPAGPSASLTREPRAPGGHPSLTVLPLWDTSRRKSPVLNHTFPCLFFFLSNFFFQIFFFFLEGEVPARPLPTLGRDQNAVMAVGTGASTDTKGETDRPDVGYKEKGRLPRQVLEACVRPKRTGPFPLGPVGPPILALGRGLGGGPAGAQGQDSSKRQGPEGGPSRQWGGLYIQV